MHRRGRGLLTLGQGPAGEEEAQAAQIWASGVLAAQEAGHAGAVEDGVNAGEALVSSFVKQGIEQQEEGSSGAGGCWWPDSATRRGQTRSWRRSGRGGGSPWRWSLVGSRARRTGRRLQRYKDN